MNSVCHLIKYFVFSKKIIVSDFYYIKFNIYFNTAVYILC
jgi:hypothetical protein